MTTGYGRPRLGPCSVDTPEPTPETAAPYHSPEEQSPPADSVEHENPKRFSSCPSGHNPSPVPRRLPAFAEVAPSPSQQSGAWPFPATIDASAPAIAASNSGRPSANTSTIHL